jgi:hypothetical protein
MDLYFIFQIFKRLYSFYFNLIVFSLFLANPELIKYEFVKKVIQRKEIKKKAFFEWKKVRKFVLKYIQYRIKFKKEIFDPYSLKTIPDELIFDPSQETLI